MPITMRFLTKAVRFHLTAAMLVIGAVDGTRTPAFAQNISEKNAKAELAIQSVKRAKTAHEALGVSESAPADEIKIAYRRLQMLLHPDRTKAAGASDAAKKINAAYDLLTASAGERRILRSSWESTYGTADSARPHRPSYSGGSSYPRHSSGYGHCPDEYEDILRRQAEEAARDRSVRKKRLLAQGGGMAAGLTVIIATQGKNSDSKSKGCVPRSPTDGSCAELLKAQCLEETQKIAGSCAKVDATPGASAFIKAMIQNKQEIDISVLEFAAQSGHAIDASQLPEFIDWKKRFSDSFPKTTVSPVELMSTAKASLPGGNMDGAVLISAYQALSNSLRSDDAYRFADSLARGAKEGSLDPTIFAPTFQLLTNYFRADDAATSAYKLARAVKAEKLTIEDFNVAFTTFASRQYASTSFEEAKQLAEKVKAGELDRDVVLKLYETFLASPDEQYQDAVRVAKLAKEGTLKIDTFLDQYRKAKNTRFHSAALEEALNQ